MREDNPGEQDKLESVIRNRVKLDKNIEIVRFVLFCFLMERKNLWATLGI